MPEIDKLAVVLPVYTAPAGAPLATVFHVLPLKYCHVYVGEPVPPVKVMLALDAPPTHIVALVKVGVLGVGSATTVMVIGAVLISLPQPSITLR